MLEPGDEVVRPAQDDHVSVRLLAPPAPGPPVEDVVEVDIGDERRDRCPLGRPLVDRLPLSVLDHPRLQPLGYEAEDPLVRDAVLEELLNPA